MKAWQVWAPVLAGSLLLSACGLELEGGGETDVMPELAPVRLAAGERLRVVATTNIVGDVVGQVAGDRIDLTVLLPVGADPHTYEPLPTDVAAVAHAHVLFVNGVGLEVFLEELLENAGGHRSVISVSEGIQLRTPAHEHEKHEHGEADPHVWFDVRNVMAWVDHVEAALAALDPANAEIYTANAEAYRAELEELDGWILEQVARVPVERRRLVTSHEALGYFADRYGFEIVGTVFPVTTDAEPSAQELAALEDAIRAHDVPAIFTETTVNPALAEQAAGDTGVRLVLLYTGSLGLPGSDVESYVELMRYDVAAIVEALK